MDSNPGPLKSEATALSPMPQPLPRSYELKKLNDFVSVCVWGDVGESVRARHRDAFCVT